MNFKKFSSLFFSLLISSAMLAQKQLSLPECRVLAINNNKSLKIASENIKKSHYEKKEALMNFFPKISASGTFIHAGRDIKLIGKDQLPSEISIPALGMNIPVPEELRESISNMTRIKMDNLWLVGISATQPLFMGGRIVAYNDLMSKAEKLAQEMKETTMTNVIVETDQAYWQVVSIANKVRLAESFVSLLEKMDNDVEELLKNGFATKADKLSVAVKLNEADVALTKAKNGLVLSKMLLCEIIGLEIDDDIILVDENLSDVETIEYDSSTLTDISLAVENRSEIRSLELVGKIYKQKEKITFADFLPEAGLRLGYDTTKPNSFNGVQNRFGGMWNVAIQLKVPLNFISSNAKYKASKSETAMHHYELEDAKTKIKLQIHQASFKFNEAQKVLNETLRNLESANENLRYANEGFEEGVISSTTALQAHTAWMTAQTEKLDAQIDVKLCKVYFDRALGILK